MAERTKTIKERNLVTITGYLKENTLEQFITKDGKNAIRGALVISTGRVESHKVQFYLSETNSKGEVSKEYEALLGMLPEKTTTIASYLNANPQADYDTACSYASKVWAAGYFDEYARNTEDRGEVSSVQIRGRRAGFKKASGDQPFSAHSRFEVEIYINELTPELDEMGEKTGRASLVGLIPVYDQSMLQIKFVAPAEDGVADYIMKNYAVSDTVHVNGVLVNVMNKVLIKSASETHFGQGGRDQYQTTFVNERRILGGDIKPIHEGEDGSITKNAVKIGLAKRASKIAANSQKKPAPKANFGKPNAAGEDEVDF